MPAHTANLFLFQDIEDSSRTSQLADSDFNALRALSDWIRAFVARPDRELGRAGPVCPFVPGACERSTLWLAPERIANRSVLEVIQLMNDYRRLLVRTAPVEGADASYKAIVIVFTDLTADRAVDLLEDVRIQELKKSSYVEDGIVVGEFHARNEGPAIRNPSFQPFKSPVPFLLMRHTVVSDWMFFLDNEDWLSSWARRFGESAVQSLAEVLRRTNWRHLDASRYDGSMASKCVRLV